MIHKKKFLPEKRGHEHNEDRLWDCNGWRQFNYSCRILMYSCERFNFTMSLKSGYIEITRFFQIFLNIENEIQKYH